jgi:hypothetical protein
MFWEYSLDNNKKLLEQLFLKVLWNDKMNYKLINYSLKMKYSNIYNLGYFFGCNSKVEGEGSNQNKRQWRNKRSFQFAAWIAADAKTGCLYASEFKKI